MGPSDWELVQRAREGDREAFRELVERYQRKIAALALGMLRNREDALDVVQETFTKAYQNLDRFKGDASFYTWLYRIAVNLCIDHQRREAKHAARRRSSRASGARARIRSRCCPTAPSTAIPSSARATPRSRAALAGGDRRVDP